jgi:hypothetical protein
MARKVTIAGQLFDLDDPYTEGHTATAMEAKALNQTRAENIRNNFAATVKKLQGEAESLTDAQVKQLQSELDAYAKAYEFSVGAGRVTDPVEKEAKRIATELLDGAIAKKGTSKKKYIEANGQEKYDELLLGLMEKEQVQKEAASIVAKRNKLADSIEF